ncbi:MAG TPA: nucleoside-diphosphate sugar epimerase/dehydratase, partial [Syntrophorhabdaceae bacterium]|nr:nucleoside-diphosphate sugar epimerase/dehydratase [Syntrophorhabdaceae bacterium]
ICSYYLSYLLRFNFNVPDIYINVFVRSVPILFVIRVICFHVFGLYRGVWRYASMNDLLRILKAVTLGTVIFSAYVFFYFRVESFPRSTVIIDWFIIITFLGGSRFFYRFFREFKGASYSGGKNVLIIGASDEGEMLLREIKKNPKMNYNPVGFIDKTKQRQGKRIHDVPVLGSLEDLKKIIGRKKIEEVIIADSTIAGKELRNIIALCNELNVQCKTIPAIGDILNGKISVHHIRNINIEDLLGREHITLNMEQIRAYLSGKRVMVTGAGGSIGSELCRQIMKIGPEKLILFDRVENELYNIDMEFSNKYKDKTYVSLLGDVLDKKRLEDVMTIYRPQVIFHAAAYKHVPITEIHPYEAVKNNIEGTLRVIEASITHRVEKFVLISTDKAVDPVNVMGATKRIAELICQGMNGKGFTKFIAVRFGNVLNSAGSVIPLFKKQIESGGPVTVTHPEMTRYFMSIPEAVQLVMQAGAIGKGGEIFVLDMGEPVKIVDLARDMIRLMGFKQDEIEIVFTGLRPGERITETLIGTEEEAQKTGHEKILMIKPLVFNWQEYKRRLDEFISEIDNLSDAEIKHRLFEIIKG